MNQEQQGCGCILILAFLSWAIVVLACIGLIEVIRRLWP